MIRLRINMGIIRSTKCKKCRKHLGESFKDFPEGTVDDGTDYWCSDRCYQSDNGYGMPEDIAEKIIGRDSKNESLKYSWKDIIFAYKLGTDSHKN